MKTIQDIIEQIKTLEKKLSHEIQQKEVEFFYKIQGGKILFEEATKRYHKTLVTRLHTYILSAAFLNILTAPVILFCLVPVIFMDLVATVYQFICFPAYNIPKVLRKDYIVIDRHALSYLNTFEKLNCVYCGYVNGLIAYVQEIAARTEQYWCPIKHALRTGIIHSRYKIFLDYGDGIEFRNKFEALRRDFEDLK